jgi:hypothetical protein
VFSEWRWVALGGSIGALRVKRRAAAKRLIRERLVQFLQLTIE